MTALEIVRIENWRVVESSGVAQTAQSMGFRLRGRAFGHPSYPDNEQITTSEILRVEGPRIFCKNRVYYLGAPSAEYLEMVAKLNVKFDESDPLGPFIPALEK